MTKLSVVSYKTMEKLLLKLCFMAVQQKGSHIFYHHPDFYRTKDTKIIN